MVEGGASMFELKVFVHEGRHFPSDTSFEVNGVFDNEQTGTGFTRLSTTPVWSGPPLTWRRDAESVRKLQSQGAHLKLTVQDDNRRLGWVTVDMRTMKQAATMYAPEGENAGSWMELSSPTFKGNKGTAAPAIRVFAALREVQPSAFARLDPRASAALSDAPELGGPSPRASLGRAVAPSPLPLPSRTSLDEVARTAPVPAPVVASPTAGDDGDPPHVLTAAGDEVLHLFSLTADVRSFKSTRRMPFPTASVVVKLTLPAALLDAVELGGRSHAAVATPVRTNPPAQVARASEVTLQNGTGTVDFGAGVMALATALASGPRVAAEVWHKDKYAEDTLLGAATVSLAPLLREPTLDGYAPVMSDTDPDTPGNPRSALLLESEAVKVGELRMVLSLAEKGPLPAWASAQPAAPRPTSAPVERSSRVPSMAVKASTLRASMERSAAVARAGAGVSADAASPDVARAAAAVPTPTAAAAKSATATATTTAAGGAVDHAEEGVRASMAAGVADSMASIDSLRKGREYAVAWELEVWKQAQEAKWTASMRAKESERMAALEGEWRRREAQRETEHRKQREELTALERKLAGAVAATEERERRLVAAEESLSVRREAERREMAQRMSEAQHAVRRLQQECEHQLEMEKGRTSDAERRAAALEERVEEADSRAAAVERAFHGYKRAHLESSEATLHAEIARLQQQRADAEQTARDATASRDRFKTQIQKMAKQVVALERERTYLRAALTSLGADAAKVAPVRGRAPKPAPSPTDFASELFGDDDGGGGGGGGGGGARGGDDGFLREFRDSIAELEAEARAAGVDENAAVVADERERRGGETGKVPFSPAGKAPPRASSAAASPAKSPVGKGPKKTAPPRSPARGGALETLKERRGIARASKDAPPDATRSPRKPPARSPAKPPRSPARASKAKGDPGSWSMESDTGLKALFASAEDYEAEEAARREAAAAAAELMEAAKDAAAEETDAKTTSAKASPAASPAKPRGPVTAASLAEKRALEKEVRRLVAERAELMATGAYSSADRVISLIDQKIAEITARVAGG